MSGPGVPPVPQERSGPLGGFRVIEVASEWTAFAGKLLGDLGAEVILVEPPEGATMRGYGPFADDRRTVESSLWWWHYQTSKLGVTLDLAAAGDAARFRRLVASADIVLEGEPPERLGVFGADGPATLLSEEPRLIWVSVTPFGRDNSRSNEPATDLTILAGGGPVWACGYDDHRIPPVRGGGNQALHTAGLYAVGRDDGRGSLPGRLRSRPARRRVHACGGQCHHGGGDVQLAGRPADLAPPNRPARQRRSDHADDGLRRRRVAGSDRSAAAIGL